MSTLVNSDSTSINPNCSMDEFIRIFVQLEKRLMIEQSDPINDFQIINDWINHFQSFSNDSNQSCKQYFLNDVIPKVTKAIMTRIYANNDQHINFAKQLLLLISMLIGNTIGMELEGLHKYLPEFLDSSNVFYCKYGGSNTNSNMNDNKKRNRDLTNNDNKSKYNHMSSFNDIDFLRDSNVGDVIDCRKSSSGKWAFASIKSLSFDNKKIEIQYQENEVIETIDLNKEGDRVAPFDTKVGIACEEDDDDDIPVLVSMGIDPQINDPDIDFDMVSFEGTLNLSSLIFINHITYYRLILAKYTDYGYAS